MKNAKLLVVDDSKAALYAVEKLLAPSGIHIVVASDGIEGQSALKKERFDVVITDLDMPNLNGLELCKWIKQDPKLSDIPVIILSSCDTDDDIEKGFRAGADAFVPKSMATAELVSSIERVMYRCNYVKSKTVLVVEDCQSIRRLTRDGLEDAGFKVATATDGIHALELLETVRPDLILTDLNMPNMSGCRLCRNLLNLERFKSIPLVIMSSISDKPVIQSLMQEGVAAYIAKPFSMNMLVLTLEKILSEHFQKIQKDRDRLVAEQRLFLGSISSLINALEARDVYTHGHFESVTRISVGIGKELGFSNEALTRLGLAGRLHDLGKIGVRDNVLLKCDELTEEEFCHIKDHTVIVKDILSPLSNMDDIVQAASSHHEHWDGSGYPNGLKGEEIPLLARIIAVADVYDALTSDRPYRDGMPREIALGIVAEGRGSHFCPAVVDAFFKHIQSLENERV